MTALFWAKLALHQDRLVESFGTFHPTAVSLPCPHHSSSSSSSGGVRISLLRLQLLLRAAPGYHSNIQPIQAAGDKAENDGRTSRMLPLPSLLPAWTNRTASQAF
ncbi:hypothetical protein PAMA_004625 [Pampus argenteus]